MMRTLCCSSSALVTQWPAGRLDMLSSRDEGQLNMLTVPEGKYISTASHQVRLGPVCVATTR